MRQDSKNVTSEKSKNTTLMQKNEEKNKKKSVFGNAKVKKVVVINNWYYMSSNEVTAKMIATLVEELGYTEIDLWEDLDILALELGEHHTIDFEPVVVEMEHPDDKEFVTKHNIKVIFAVTFSDGLLEVEKKIIGAMIDKWGGMLCGDSDDFMPIYGNGGLSLR